MRRWYVFVLVFVLIASLGGVCKAVPVEWPVSSGGNGHLYEAVLVPEGIDWQSATQTAEQSGGWLATITSEAENVFVTSLISGREDEFFQPPYVNPEQHYLNAPWIGGFQPDGSPEPAGNWQWVTGEPFTYTNWAPLEPNNEIYGDEDSLQLYLGGWWNDLPHSGFQACPHGYIVEYIPEPATLLLLALGTLALRKRKYYHF